jgi:DNA-binding PucR family transcriptional regulator
MSTMPSTFEQTLADQLETDAAKYAELILGRVQTEVPELLREAELAATAAVASRSLMAEFAVALRLGVEHARLHAPAAPIAYARQLARDGIGLPSILRSYRLGQQIVFELAAQLADQLPQPEDRVQALARVGKLSFQFVDSVMTDIANEYEAQRELFVRGSYARRHTLVRDMLAGLPFDPLEAERTLGYRLHARHLAHVVWTGDGRSADEQTLVGAARPLTQTLGEGRPLVVADSDGAVTIWVTPTQVDPPRLQSTIETLQAADAFVAVGRPGAGPHGFIASKRQADLTRSVARLHRDRHITWYSDVALAAVLLRDRDAARTFAEEELRDLVQPTRAAADLRETLSAYFAAGLDQSRAARDLHLHRNTIAKRLRRAEALLGHPLTKRPRELEAALVIADALVAR